MCFSNENNRENIYLYEEVLTNWKAGILLLPNLPNLVFVKFRRQGKEIVVH